ncbi:heavy-metal-associated domain-containing protein [Mesorhizobium amorphae]|uniref:heavy-metal-associated domain-containing protein n=1 Tax=Mesorhizobium amorphae TaxID=71433 RepID=UPI001182C395|nr:heavy-metal-associated domain-containing protein [Mesorhizobium amorphae]
MLNLKVPEMTCGHCASTVEKAVKGVDPKAKVTVDLGASTVSVEGAATKMLWRPQSCRPATPTRSLSSAAVAAATRALRFPETLKMLS